MVPDFMTDSNGVQSFRLPVVLNARDSQATPIQPCSGFGNCRRGFTLIELMVVVVVIAILASIAYSSYANQIRKARRSAAQSYMMAFSAKEQQTYLDTRQFSSVADNTAADAILELDTTVSSYYDITVTTTSGPPPTFTITATPNGGTNQYVDGALTLDNSGSKSPSDKW
ncbi:MAG: pilus assembly protein [Magnetococcales bacterium]|nr:pilus assembly protein [Magnetococcales bacterium]